MLVASDEATAGSVIAKRRADLALEQRLEPLALLCLGRAVARQHFHVAGVGRRAVEHLGRPVHAAHDLAQRRVLEVGEPGAVLGLPAGTGSTARGARLAASAPRSSAAASSACRLRVRLELGRVALLGRIDVLVHEGASAAACSSRDLRRVVEVHGALLRIAGFRPDASRARPAAVRGARLARLRARRGAVDHALGDALQDRGDAGTCCRPGRSPSPRVAMPARDRCARNSAATYSASVGMPSAARSRPPMPRNDARRDVPGHAVVGEVGQRMAERRQLPVEHGEDARLGRVEDQVVEPEVAVHDPTVSSSGGNVLRAASRSAGPSPRWASVSRGLVLLAPARRSAARSSCRACRSPRGRPCRSRPCAAPR